MCRYPAAIIEKNIVIPRLENRRIGEQSDSLLFLTATPKMFNMAEQIRSSFNLRVCLLLLKSNQY